MLLTEDRMVPTDPHRLSLLLRLLLLLLSMLLLLLVRLMQLLLGWVWMLVWRIRTRI
jgi:hypothetical protein